MLTARRLSKAFSGTIALDDFSLELTTGEFLVLLGPSGCGKTTLIRVIAGLERPDKGEVFLAGKNCTSLTPQERNIAMVFQHFALYPHRTVRANIEYPLRMRGQSPQLRAGKVERITAFLGISQLVERKPGDLSGGEAQRVALARALVREPSCFLLDEPLSNLDAQLRVRARAEIKRIQRNLKVTTIYVTHDQEEAVALGDRIAIMNKGRLVQVGTPEELFRHPATTFVASFLGRPPMNLISGTVVHHSDAGSVISLENVRGPRVTFRGIRGNKISDGQRMCVGLRPDDVLLGEIGTFGECGELTLPVEVEMVEGLEPDFIAHCQTPAGAILVRTRARPIIGSASILLQSTKAYLFDAETGKRIE